MSFVFNRATVRPRVRRRDWFAGERFVERDFDVIGRIRNVRRIWRGFAVNRTFVDQFSFRIDHGHVRRVFCPVGAPGFAFRIEKKRGLMRFPLRHFLHRLLRRKVPFGSRRVGIDRQPDNAFTGVFFLQLLHVAAAVMLFHERAFRIEPLQHDVFAFVLR